MQCVVMTLVFRGAMSLVAPPSPRLRTALQVRRYDDLPEVGFLRPLDWRDGEYKPSRQRGHRVMPLFPLPGTYVPGSQVILNIFEPRYRKLYSDILQSGERKLVVTFETGYRELAEVGVVLHVDDLKEVSEQTDNKIKYVCSHTVLETPVRIHRVLNPKDDRDKKTYFRCEVSDVTDVEDEDDLDLEAQIAQKLVECSDLQASYGDVVRFQKDAVEKLTATRGVGAGSLWSVVELWANFLDGKAQVMAQKERKLVQDRLVDFLSNRTETSGEVPSQIPLSALPDKLRKDIENLPRSVEDKLEPITTAKVEGIQRLLQATKHTDRLKLFLIMISAESRRLENLIMFNEAWALDVDDEETLYKNSRPYADGPRPPPPPPEQDAS